MFDTLKFDRDTYRQFKSMNREKMLGVLQDIYRDGVQDGIASTEAVDIDMDKMRSEIGEIKGIGEARLNQIMDIIKKNLTNE